MIRLRSSVLLGAGFLLALSCAGGRHAPRGEPDGPTAALYRARFVPGGGAQARSFRFLVYAARPDRLHGEVLSSIGTTELILDAGSATVSVFFVRDGVAYVGDATERALDALLGVRLDPRDLVAVLLGDAPGPSSLDWIVVPGDDGYPRSVELGDGSRRLRLELKRLQTIRADPRFLGTGRPPDGAEERPLELLDPARIPGVETEHERGSP